VSALPKFGRYVTVERLGGGAAGEVYRAHDELLGRDVAIKTVRAAGRHAVLSLERFFHEARAVAALSHPGVIRIFDMGETDGTPYLVMELATGGSLADRLTKGPRLSVDEACAVGIQIAQALAAAHARGIVHRDVKPANIVRDGEGGWKLADFGVAHVPDSTLTLAGQFLGSPAYAAAESLEAGEFGAASDVYGLAATLHEALTGAPPWGDRDYAAILGALDDGVTSIAGRAPELPPPVAKILDRALARRPDERPSAQQLAVALAERDGVPATTLTTIVAASAVPTRTLVIAGLVAILVVGLVAALASRGGGDRAAAPATRPSDAAPVHVGDDDPFEDIRAAMGNGDYEAAEHLLEDLLERDPDNATARRYLDQVRQALGRDRGEDRDEDSDEGFVPPGQAKKKDKHKKKDD